MNTTATATTLTAPVALIQGEVHTGETYHADGYVSDGFIRTCDTSDGGWDRADAIWADATLVPATETYWCLECIKRDAIRLEETLPSETLQNKARDAANAWDLDSDEVRSLLRAAADRIDALERALTHAIGAAR